MPKGYLSRNYLKDLDRGARCAICGNETLLVLQWAHKDPKDKLFNISGSWKSHGLAAVAAEISKCVRLCCNCHLMADAGMIDISSMK